MNETVICSILKLLLLLVDLATARPAPTTTSTGKGAQKEKKKKIAEEPGYFNYATVYTTTSQFTLALRNVRRIHDGQRKNLSNKNLFLFSVFGTKYILSKTDDFSHQSVGKK